MAPKRAKNASSEPVAKGAPRGQGKAPRKPSRKHGNFDIILDRFSLSLYILFFTLIGS